jgi:hypothetical protein
MAVIIGVALSIFYFENKYSANRDDAKLFEIQQLYSKLPLHSDLKERGSSFQSKAELALVGKYFDSGTSYDEVKDFYRHHLTEAGWSPTGEKPITDWARDFGGRSLEFRRGEYRLVIEYAGERANDDWDYAITLIWKQG